MDGQDRPTRPGGRVPAQRDGGAGDVPGQRPYVERSRALRFWMLVGVLAIEAIAMGIAISGYFPDSASGASGADFWAALAEAAGFAALTLLGVHLVVFAVLAPSVSYRWYDTFFLLVPVVAVVFWFRVVWRLTALPERYWPARDDELPEHPRRPVVEDVQEDARAWR